MPLYTYEHPKTGEVFEELRPLKNRNDPFVSPDGETCIRIIGSPGYCGRSENDREVFELDRDYCKKMAPKWVKFRDGHREKYDPNKHS
jgi:hypothetical protein